MTAPAWMPLYIADYLADTSHLTTVEHGAYLLLIMHYWRNGGLPRDDGKLARIVGLPEPKWSKMRPSIRSFFTKNWKHKRIDKELAEAAETMSKRSAAGKAAAAVRHANRSSNAEQSHTPSPSPSPSPSPKQEERSPPSGGERARARAAGPLRGKMIPLPEDWQPSKASLTKAWQRGFAERQIGDMAEAMRSWAQSIDARKVSWDATFDGWIRREAQRPSMTGPSRKKQGVGALLAEFERKRNGAGNETPGGAGDAAMGRRFEPNGHIHRHERNGSAEGTSSDCAGPIIDLEAEPRISRPR